MKRIIFTLFFVLLMLFLTLSVSAQQLPQDEMPEELTGDVGEFDEDDLEEEVDPEEGFEETDFDMERVEEDREVVCGDGVCYEGQNYFNCPQDCDFFDSQLALNQIRLIEGEPVYVPIRIKQFVNGSFTYNISASPELEPFVEFKNDSFEIENYSMYFEHLVFNISERTDMNNSFGDIIIENKHESDEIPVFLELIISDERMLGLSHDVLTEEIFLGEELVYLLEADFYTSFDSPATAKVFLEHSETGNSWLLDNITLDTGERHEKVLSQNINESFFKDEERGENDTIEFGVHDLIVQLEVEGRTAQSYSTLSIEQSFFDTFYFKALVVVLISLPIAILIIKFYPKFKAYLESRKRYIVPNIKELPNAKTSGTLLKVGKIPETKYDAYLAAKDLNTHAIVAGSTGSGKSVSASIIAEEALNNKIPVVVFDPTSQWTGFLSALKDEKILKHYPKFKMSREDAKSYKGLIFTPKDADFEINFDEYLNPGEITVFNLANLSTKQYDEATAKIVEKIFEKKWEEDPELKLLCVFDEVHRLLESSCEGKGYSALTRGAREFRKWGIGLLMASQILSDFKEAVGGNVLTEVQLNTKNISDIKKAEQKYGTAYAKRITRQSVGVSLVQNPKYNNGQPWFIHFRPPMHDPHKLSEEDLASYEKFTSRIKELKQKMQELKDKGEDVSEFEMDLNLANNKLKEGKFKMTDIYIEEIEGALKRYNKQN